MSHIDDGLGAKLPLLGYSLWQVQDNQTTSTLPPPLLHKPQPNESATVTSSSRKGQQVTYDFQWRPNEGIMVLYVREGNQAREGRVTIARLKKMRKTALIDVLSNVLTDVVGS